MTPEQKNQDTQALFFYLWAQFRNVSTSDFFQSVNNGKTQAKADGVFIYGHKIWGSVTHYDGRAIDITAFKSNRSAHKLMYAFFERYKNYEGIRLGIGLNHIHLDTHTDYVHAEKVSFPWKGKTKTIRYTKNGNSLGAKYWLEDKIRGKFTVYKTPRDYKKNYKRIIARFLGESTKSKDIKNEDSIIATTAGRSNLVLLLAIAGGITMIYRKSKLEADNVRNGRF